MLSGSGTQVIFPPAFQALPTRNSYWLSTDRAGRRGSCPIFSCCSPRLTRAPGRAEVGMALLAEALSAAETTNERWCKAEIHRLNGQLPQTTRDPDETVVETCFRRAVIVAKEQKAKL